jgi:hypothetical protein
MGKGLPAKQAIIGQYVGQMTENLKAQQALALQRVQEEGAMARTRLTTQTQRDIAAQKTETKPEDQVIRLVPPKKTETDQKVPPTMTPEQVQGELRKRFFLNPVTAGTSIPGAY